MVEPGERPGLGQVRLDLLRAGDPIGVRHLDGDRAVEFLVTREIDPPEGPLAQPSNHPVAADKRGITLRDRRSRARITVRAEFGRDRFGDRVLRGRCLA